MLITTTSVLLDLGCGEYWSTRMEELSGHKPHRAIFQECMRKVYSRLYHWYMQEEEDEVQGHAVTFDYWQRKGP